MSYPLVILDRMMAERHADEALAVKGDDEFRAFYERTARPSWAYLSRISGDPHKADDFLQEADRHEPRARRGPPRAIWLLAAPIAGWMLIRQK